MNSDLLFATITDLGKLYRAKQVSPVEVVQAVLERAGRLNPRLNAFITLLREDALQAARQAEQDFARGVDRGPLQGVPFSLKDIFDTAGIPTTAGSPQWRGRVPDQTATSARRLLDAGGILIGKCNLLEFAYGIVHPEFGQCNNPWDTGRTSGGSSSGSAASIAAGIGYGSLGTDTGGSIRIPAAYCGVVGLKPTYGRVSRHGVFPLSWSLDHVGTLARSVEDTALLLGIIAGRDDLDVSSAHAAVPDYRAALTRRLDGVRVGVLEQHMDHPDLRPGVGEATWAAVRELEKLGATLVPIRLNGLDEADPAMLVTILPEATLAHETMLRTHPERYAEMTRQQFELGTLLPAVDYLRAQQYRTRLMNEFMAALRNVDVLVNPSVAFEAPAEDPVVAAGEGSDEARRTGPYNLTGLPAVSVPCGFGPQGLPLGLQVAAAPFAEETLLRVAYAYEQHAGWGERRPPLDG